MKHDHTTRPVFEDKQLICVDCQHPFTFSASEARYFWERGLTETKRCPDCRLRRKLTLHRDFDTDISKRSSPIPGAEGIKYGAD